MGHYRVETDLRPGRIRQVLHGFPASGAVADISPSPKDLRTYLVE